MSPARSQRIAGIVLLFGFVYLAFEFITAMAWVDPPYDWAANYISDLGFADCAVVEGMRLCSPLHPLMNAGFMVQGTVFTIGSVLVVRLMLPGRWMRVLVGTLLVLSGAGTFLVGVFHQSLGLYEAGLNGFHVLAALLAIGAGNVGILLLGLLVLGQREWRGYGIAVAIIGVIGIAAGLLLLARNDLGLGIGAIERIAVYPLNAWTVGTGVGLLVKGIRDRRRLARARARAASDTASPA
jgi:hypothetical membrane protein